MKNRIYILRHAWKHISRIRIYSAINIIGLVICLTGTVIIARYVHQELTVDDYVPNVDRVMLLLNQEENGSKQHSDAENWNHVDNWDDPFMDPAVDYYTCFHTMTERNDVTIGDIHYQPTIILADSMFLRIFPRRALEGKLTMTAATDVVVSKRFAQKVWGEESPVGKHVVLDEYTLNVVGVADDAGTKCNLDFDMLIDNNLLNYRLTVIGWSAIVFKEGEDYREFNKRHHPYIENSDANNRWHFQVLPLKEAYFDLDVGRYDKGIINQGNRDNILMLSIAAILLLSIGLFNYLNISSIVMTHRKNDFIVKKVFGANRWDVFGQMMCENMVMSALSVLMAWIIVAVTTPLLQKIYSLGQVTSASFDIVLSLAITLLFPLIVSLWTFLQNRSANDVADARKAARKSNQYRLQNVALVLQYTVTFFLIVVSIYTTSQLRYMLNADMGYRTTDILACNILPASYIQRTEENWDRLMAEEAKRKQCIKEIYQRLKETPLIEKYAFTDAGENVSLTTKMSVTSVSTIAMKRADSDQAFIPVECMWMPKDVFDLYELKLIEGEELKDTGNVFTSYRCYVTENVLKLLDIKDIKHDLIQFDKRLWHSAWVDDSSNPPFEIQGVIRDFTTHHLALSDAPKAIIIENTGGGWGRVNWLLVRASPGRRADVLKYLQKLYEEYNGDGSEMEYTWIEDNLAAIYDDDKRTTNIYSTFALLAILVSALGLLGVSLHNLQHRRREIAIRRVNGAKMKDVFRLIARKFAIALAIAVAIGTPLSVYALHFYMDNYANHIPLSPLYFVFATCILLAITFAIVYSQIRKAMRTNPSVILGKE